MNSPKLERTLSQETKVLEDILAYDRTYRRIEPLSLDQQRYDYFGQAPTIDLTNESHVDSDHEFVRRYSPTNWTTAFKFINNKVYFESDTGYDEDDEQLNAITPPFSPSHDGGIVLPVGCVSGVKPAYSGVVVSDVSDSDLFDEEGFEDLFSDDETIPIVLPPTKKRAITKTPYGSDVELEEAQAKGRGPQGVRWALTVNSPDMDCAEMKDHLDNTERVRGYVFQKEISKKGTEHFQMYMKYQKKCTKKQLVYYLVIYTLTLNKLKVQKKKILNIVLKKKVVLKKAISVVHV